MPSDEGARTRPRACIHVDLDSVWAMGKSFELDLDIDPDPILHSSIGNFLDIFERFGIKATFFLAGRDAANTSNAGIIANIIDAGHEIANHGMNHTPNFTKLPELEIESEITESAKAIESATGQQCRGFRAPTYNVNGFILRLLQETGYLYDSSILPTFISPIYRMLNVHCRTKSLAYGSVSHVLAPLAPYHPDEINPWRRGSMSIVEIPISTVPFIRLPFHTSYVFQTGLPLFKFGITLTRLAGTDLVYVFHARELAQCEGDWFSKLPFKELPFGTRKAIYETILTTIRDNFDLTTTLDLVEAARARSTASQ